MWTFPATLNIEIRVSGPWLPLPDLWGFSLVEVPSLIHPALLWMFRAIQLSKNITIPGGRGTRDSMSSVQSHLIWSAKGLSRRVNCEELQIESEFNAFDLLSFAGIRSKLELRPLIRRTGIEKRSVIVDNKLILIKIH